MRKTLVIVLLLTLAVYAGAQLSGVPVYGPMNILGSAAGVLGLKQGVNNTTMLYGVRQTDSSPTGYFVRLRNAANNADLYSVDVKGSVYVSGGYYSGPGFQHKRTTTCNPTGTLVPCGIVVNWPVNFPDLNYTFNCFLDNPNNQGMVMYGNAKAVGSISVAVANLNGASPITSGTVDCVAFHDPL